MPAPAPRAALLRCPRAGRAYKSSPHARAKKAKNLFVLASGGRRLYPPPIGAPAGGPAGLFLSSLASVGKGLCPLLLKEDFRHRLAHPKGQVRRQILPDDASRAVDRSCFVAVQTPQTFRCGEIKRAYEQPYRPTFTDDASVYEAAGYIPRLVEGNRETLKITLPVDLALAEILLSR